MVVNIKKIAEFIGKNNAYRIADSFAAHIPSQLLYFGAPSVLMIEPTNVCNLSCPLCPSNTCMERGKGHMTLDNFKVIIDEIAGKVEYVYLYHFGEPFLNSNILKMIQYAGQRSIKVRISTNGTQLKNISFDSLLHCGLDSIAISMAAADKEAYRAYYKTDAECFDEIINGVESLCVEKRRLRLSKPRIDLIYLISRDNEKGIKRIAALANSLKVDALLLKTIALDLGNYKLTAERKKELARLYLPEDGKNKRYDINGDGMFVAKSNEICEWVFIGSVILWNGDVTTCCRDYDGLHRIGNVFEEGFFNIYRSKKYRDIRKKMLKKELFLCKNCQKSSLNRYLKPVIFNGGSQNALL